MLRHGSVLALISTSVTLTSMYLFQIFTKGIEIAADLFEQHSVLCSSAEFTQFLLALIQSWPQVSNEAPIYRNQGT